MKKCNYCHEPMPLCWERRGLSICSGCRERMRLVKDFMVAAEEFKQIIGYDEILRKREKEKRRQASDQGTAESL